jgi:hypothetical protein
MFFPREPKQAGGWTIQYNFLDDVKVAIEKESPEFVPSMEEIEAVLLAVERLTTDDPDKEDKNNKNSS